MPPMLGSVVRPQIWEGQGKAKNGSRDLRQWWRSQRSQAWNCRWTASGAATRAVGTHSLKSADSRTLQSSCAGGIPPWYEAVRKSVARVAAPAFSWPPQQTETQSIFKAKASWAAIRLTAQSHELFPFPNNKEPP